ncbi:BCS1 N terminal-domain-containing protein [Xylogone sp. PMI_703]|nr:BCS1 N terminal-domain-containing protein [Xylogone sp. PMI_703]
MSVQSILGAAFPAQSNMSNKTAPAASTGPLLPTTLLETFIPGYNTIHRLVLDSFGFDVTVLVSFGAALWVTARISQSLWKLTTSFVQENYMSEITISSTDEIYSHIILFLANRSKLSRRLMATTPAVTPWELDTAENELHETTVDAEGNIKWLNFSNQEAKSQPRFTPAVGSHNFWHNGSYLQVRRKEVTMLDDLSSGTALFKDRELLTLSCFGRSPEPIKELIQHAKEQFHQGYHAKTIIKRPAQKDMRRFGGRGSWIKIAERPCRPMKTVVLDEAQKLELLADINEYLSPATARWYANRGIPYRRGYLFHGPPGTGKTSLTAAIAGIFGLVIHVVSLLEPTLTEEELGMLFTNLPARSIILLEDIDTAGLERRQEPEEDEKSTKTGRDELDVVTLTKAFKRANQQTEEERKKGISLSGLLNILDGVSSAEGRVLIMTTNHPERLDDALIRPGRVDHQVAFTNATQSQAKELFERMYTNDLPRTHIIPTNSQEQTRHQNGHVREKQDSKVENERTTPQGTQKSLSINKYLNKTISPEIPSDAEISEAAEEFASKVPSGMFSPAEIQGFLLKRKKEPLRARDEAEKWVEEMILAKETKKAAKAEEASKRAESK